MFSAYIIEIEAQDVEFNIFGATILYAEGHTTTKRETLLESEFTAFLWSANIPACSKSNVQTFSVKRKFSHFNLFCTENSREMYQNVYCRFIAILLFRIGSSKSLMTAIARWFCTLYRLLEFKQVHTFDALFYARCCVLLRIRTMPTLENFLHPK